MTNKEYNDIFNLHLECKNQSYENFKKMEHDGDNDIEASCHLGKASTYDWMAKELKQILANEPVQMNEFYEDIASHFDKRAREIKKSIEKNEDKWSEFDKARYLGQAEGLIEAAKTIRQMKEDEIS